MWRSLSSYVHCTKTTSTLQRRHVHNLFGSVTCGYIYISTSHIFIDTYRFYIYIYIYAAVMFSGRLKYIIYKNIYAAVLIYLRKTETANLRLVSAIGKCKFVFPGRQTIKGNRRLLFQQTCPAVQHHSTLQSCCFDGAISSGRWEHFVSLPCWIYEIITRPPPPPNTWKNSLKLSPLPPTPPPTPGWPTLTPSPSQDVEGEGGSA